MLTPLPEETEAALARRVALMRGASVCGPEDAERILAAFEGLDLPIEAGPIHFYPIKSLRRSTMRRTLGGRSVILHDEELSDTLHLLEIAHIGEERPLMAWAVFARVLAEFMLAGPQPVLGLCMALQAEAQGERFAREDGAYDRPQVIARPGEFAMDAPIDDVLTQYSAERLEGGKLQRLIVLLHEIGHGYWDAAPDWRAYWTRVAGELIDPLYQADPLGADVRYGLLRIRDMPDAEKAEKAAQLIAGLTEEIACDYFALTLLFHNQARVGLEPEAMFRAFFRFLRYVDLLGDVRQQANERAQNKVRFRSVSTNVDLRMRALFKLLTADVPGPWGEISGTLKGAEAELRALDLEALQSEFRTSQYLAGQIASMALTGPAPWERDRHYGKMPRGYLSGIDPEDEAAVAERAELFMRYLGDHLLEADFEPEKTRTAPHSRAAGHLLSRSRAWAYDYFSKQAAVDAELAEIARDLEQSRPLAARFYNDVWRDKAALRFRIRLAEDAFHDIGGGLAG